MKKIKLEDFINELELISDDGQSFMNKTTGQLFYFGNKVLEYIEDGIRTGNDIPGSKNENVKIAREVIETDNYLKLPTENEINESKIIIDFCLSHADERIYKKVKELIKNDNAKSSKLRELIWENNLGKDWYKFKRKAFKKIAIEWCKKNKVEFF